MEPEVRDVEWTYLNTRQKRLGDSDCAGYGVSSFHKPPLALGPLTALAKFRRPPKTWIPIPCAGRVG